MKEDIQEKYFGKTHITVIKANKGWRALDFRELWAYRELLFVFTSRDIKAKYKQTVLGVSWAIIRPFVTMVIFSVVFGGLAKMPSDGYPYPIFLFAALLPWTFFSTAISNASGSLISSSHIVSKVYFPRLIIPLSSCGAALVDLSISTIILLSMMLYFGVGWTTNLIAAPFLVMGVIFTALGFGTFLSALAVAYRDVNHLLTFLIQIWMYITPVIYPVKLLPEKWQWLLYINPMTGYIEGFRSAFLGKSFDVGSLVVSLLVSLAIFIYGVAYFEKVERRFADII